MILALTAIPSFAGTRLVSQIAETSITIDDVVYVVDCGRVKENRYDSTNHMAMLMETWVSKASARQRRGRAGRVQSGICYHLFTSVRVRQWSLCAAARRPATLTVLSAVACVGGVAATVHAAGDAALPAGRDDSYDSHP